MKMNRICAILNLTEDETALKPLTRIRPIASLPFASRYRLIDFNLSSISHAEIKSVGMFIAGSGRSIYDHIRSGSVWNLESGLTGGIFTYSQQVLKAVQEKNGDAPDFYMNHKEFIERSKANTLSSWAAKSWRMSTSKRLCSIIWQRKATLLFSIRLYLKLSLRIDRRKKFFRSIAMNICLHLIDCRRCTFRT